MKLLKLEFYKCRRRQILPLCAAVLGLELLWAASDLPDAAHLGWAMLFYDLAILDAILMPICVAMIASRSCEPEHKGSTWKLLETMVSPGALYFAKLAWGGLTLAGLLLLRSGLLLGLGTAYGLPGEPPYGRLALFALVTWAVSMMVYALQQGLSLRFANQAAALVCGVFGSFIGFLSLLFPPFLIRLVPWGYYGLLALSYMEWNPTTRMIRYHWQTPHPWDLLFLLLWATAFLLIGRTLFLRKEV